MLLLLGMSDVYIEANDSLLQVPMAPKKYLVYSRGPSKCVVPSHRLVISSDVDNDLEYMSPSTQTPTRASRTTRGMTMKVELDLVTTS